MNVYTIYALTDQNDNIRYIGYTSKSIKKRLSEHIYASLKGREQNCHRCKWIKSLLKSGTRPSVKALIQVDTLDKVKLLEIELIKHYKQFVKLTNNTSGGDGTTGLKWSEEAKNKIKGRKIDNSKILKQVEGINLITKEYKKFSTAKEASEYINCYIDSVRMVCRNQRSSVFNWKLNYITK